MVKYHIENRGSLRGRHGGSESPSLCRSSKKVILVDPDLLLPRRWSAVWKAGTQGKCAGADSQFWCALVCSGVLWCRSIWQVQRLRLPCEMRLPGVLWCLVLWCSASCSASCTAHRAPGPTKTFTVFASNHHQSLPCSSGFNLLSCFPCSDAIRQGHPLPWSPSSTPPLGLIVNQPDMTWLRAVCTIRLLSAWLVIGLGHLH